MPDIPHANRFNPSYPDDYIAIDDNHKVVISTDIPLEVAITEPLEVEFASAQDVNIASQDSDIDANITNDNIDATRESAYTTLTIANAANVSTTFDMSKFSSGVLLIPIGFAGYIHFEDSEDGVTFNPMCDEFGAAITITQFATPSVAALRYALPAKLFGCGIVRVAAYIGNTRASGAQNQTGVQTLRVRLKS